MTTPTAASLGAKLYAPPLRLLRYRNRHPAARAADDTLVVREMYPDHTIVRALRLDHGWIDTGSIHLTHDTWHILTGGHLTTIDGDYLTAEVALLDTYRALHDVELLTPIIHDRPSVAPQRGGGWWIVFADGSNTTVHGPAWPRIVHAIHRLAPDTAAVWTTEHHPTSNPVTHSTGVHQVCSCGHRTEGHPDPAAALRALTHHIPGGHR